MAIHDYLQISFIHTYLNRLQIFVPDHYNMQPSLTHQTHMPTANALYHLAPSYLNLIIVTLLYTYTNVCCTLKCYCNISHSNNRWHICNVMSQKGEIKMSLLFDPADKKNSGCRGQYLASIPA
jgi:hypothetical protein